jgi:predicted O-methyltransferase YrrM
MSDAHRATAAFLEDLHPDPFAHVRDASNAHREFHGGDCGVYPSDPLKLRFMANLVRAMGAKHILEIGCGLGYSALWLADAVGPSSRITTIDRFPEHAELALGHAEEAGLAKRMEVLTGEGEDLIPGTGPFDFVHDDGWFAEKPRHFQVMLDVVRPGGVIAMSNWFLLVQSMADKPNMDWSQFAGPDWRDKIQAFARELAAQRGLEVSWIIDPGVALAFKKP